MSAKDYMASLRERAKIAFDSAIVQPKATTEIPSTRTESTSPNLILIPSPTPTISNIPSPTLTSQASEVDEYSSGESFQYVRGTIRESSEESSDNVKGKGKLFISTQSSAETVVDITKNTIHALKDFEITAPSTSGISDRTVRPLPSSSSIKPTPSLISNKPLATSHPFYSIHDPRNIIDTPEPQESSTTTSISPSTVETDDGGWYDTKKFTSSPISDQHSASSMREVAKLRKSYELQSLEFQKLVEQNNSAHLALEEANSRLEATNNKLKAKEAKEIELRGRIAAKKEEIKKFKDLSNNFEDVKERLVGATQEILEHQLKEEAFIKSLDDKEHEVKAVEAEIESLKNQAAAYRQDCKNLKTELKLAKEVSSSIKLELNETKEDLRKSLSKIQDLDITFGNLLEAKARNESDQARILVLEDSKAAIELEKNRYFETLQSLETKFKKSEIDYQTSTRQLALVEGERELLLSQNSALKVQVAELTKAITDQKATTNQQRDSVSENEDWKSKYLALQAEKAAAVVDIQLIPDLLAALDLLSAEKEGLESELKHFKEIADRRDSIGRSDGIVENPTSESLSVSDIDEPQGSLSVEKESATSTISPSIPVGSGADVPTGEVSSSKVSEVAPKIEINREGSKSGVESGKVEEGDEKEGAKSVEEAVAQESVPVLGSIENLSLPPSLHGQVMEKEVGAEPEEETLDELLRSAENAINETTLVEAVLAEPNRVNTPTPIFDFGNLSKT